MASTTGRVAVVTGGGGGIGRAAAILFATQGYHVVVTGRRSEPLEALSAEYRGIGYVVADAASPDDAMRTVRETVDRHGRLDVLVNNAGAGAILRLGDTGLKQLTDTFSINVFGPTLLASAAIHYLKASRGCIVNVSSTFGHKAVAGLSLYAASKAALEHLTRCWALELAPEGVRVNAVAAGPTESDFLEKRMQLSPEQIAAIKADERNRIPLGRRGVPEDVARWIVAISAPETWITGQIYAVDGGLSTT